MHYRYLANAKSFTWSWIAILIWITLIYFLFDDLNRTWWYPSTHWTTFPWSLAVRWRHVGMVTSSSCLREGICSLSAQEVQRWIEQILINFFISCFILFQWIIKYIMLNNTLQWKPVDRISSDMYSKSSTVRLNLFK